MANTAEKFEFSWIGKKAAKAEVKSKAAGKLRPCFAESKYWDDTQNLYIEGDNIDALKHLRKTHTGQVSMMFIDPPYNTGSNHFVYADSYNHSQWCSMMYPRLVLAHELLADDGVIFITLDDRENAHTRMMMNEIFGEENFVCEFIWEKKKKPSFLHRNVGKLFDYILCYAKKAECTDMFSIEKTTIGKKYPLNNAGNPRKVLVFPPRSVQFGFESQIIKAQDMSEGNIHTKLLNRVVVKNYINQTEMQLEGEWRYSQQKLDQIIADGEKIQIHQVPFRPNHVKSGGERKAMKNILSLTHYECETNEDGSAQIFELFGANVFETPKPVGLVKLLIQAVTYNNPSAVVMDFFGGSSSTAHAVMEVNAEDGGDRKFIMIQIPEECNHKGDAYKAGYKNICEIGKERIRRAEECMRRDYGSAVDQVDTGFRVYKIK